MAYLPREILEGMRFKKLGEDVKVSDKASIYNPEAIEIDDHSRIDDFCVISGNVKIGKFNHITPMCLVAGGKPGVFLSDFCTLAYGVKIFSQSDDYSGETLVNSLVHSKYKNERFASVFLYKHVVVGAGSIIMPGVTVAEGCSIGAMTLINKSTQEWGVYVGSPARRLKDRKKNLIALEKKFLDEFYK